MSRVRKSTAGGKATADGQIDFREQPYNACEIGTIEQVQLSQAMITSLHGIVLDLDVRLLRKSSITEEGMTGPRILYRKTVAAWLANHPVLSRAEVRNTGRGLHVILWLSEPVTFATDGDRQRWAGIVKVVQSVLPIDPDQPGMTCLTRPVGSINGRCRRAVKVLSPRQPISADEVLELSECMIRAPFRTVSKILFGAERVTPCPICGREGSSLAALDRVGRCYGSCGQIKVASLYDLFLLPRSKEVRSLTARTAPSRGQELEDRLRAAIALVNQALLPDARDLPILRGLLPTGVATQPLENVQAAARRILVESGRIYRYGDSVYYAQGEGVDGKLVPLTSGPRIEPIAPAMLANVFLCEHETRNEPIQFPPPGHFLSVLLNGTPTEEALPRIHVYATRPVFDDQLQLHGPGWHPEKGILVHGPDVEPIIPPVADPDRCLEERLPHHLGVLLGDFCFRSPADRVNAIGAMLTGLLMYRFVAAGKPVNLLDGNQPGVGKTLLARVLGIILDGIDPQLIHYTSDDEELAKRICATLRSGSQSILLIDNAKVKAGGSVSSPVIEANALAPQISLRILGVSANHVRTNDLLWFLTMNDTKTSSDLVSRGLPIRFSHDGNPSERDFAGRDPLVYAHEHRIEILGELMGMVIRWNQAGRPEGTRRHRCDRWARDIGGILETAGLPEFLANLDEAAICFNETLDELVALAEAAVAYGSPAVVYPVNQPDHQRV